MRFETRPFTTSVPRDRRVFGELVLKSLFSADESEEETAAVAELSFDDLSMKSLYSADDSVEVGASSVADLSFDDLDMKSLYSASDKKEGLSFGPLSMSIGR